MKYDIIAPCFPLLDVIVPMEDFLPVQAGESKIAHSITDEAGGPANSFFVATRIGAKVLPVGVVGDDYHGQFLLDTYTKEGVDISGLKVLPGYATPQALCIVDAAGKHAFITMVHGRMAVGLETLKHYIDQGRSMVLTGYLLASDFMRDTIHQAVIYLGQNGKELFFDPGPLINKIPSGIIDGVLRHTTTLVVNDEEAALLAGCKTIEENAAVMYGRVNGIVVIKAGPKGCYVFDGKQGAWYPGFQVPLVDTTAAGDSFLGAFMYGRLSGWDMKTVATLANAAGAVKVAKLGSGRQVPAFQEIVALLERDGYVIDDKIKRGGKFTTLDLHNKSQ